MRATEYVRCDRTNDLIGPRQFGWSANFENSMKARARCSPAMKLSIPGETYFTYCRTVSNRVSMNLSLFYRPRTRPHVLNCPRNELSDPTRCSFHRWHRQCPTSRHSTHSSRVTSIAFSQLSVTAKISLARLSDLSTIYRLLFIVGAWKSKHFLLLFPFFLFILFVFLFHFGKFERFWIYSHKDVRAKSYSFQTE